MSIIVIHENMTCPRCHGEGYEEYEEDPGRYVRDACYHCGTTGEVDPDTYFQDQLISVANTLARMEETEYKHWCNNDPDGDGYDLHAAENMLHTGDYFNLRVWDRSVDIAEKLNDMSRADQELLIAWNELPYQGPAIVVNKVVPVSPIHIVEAEYTEDDIPF